MLKQKNPTKMWLEGKRCLGQPIDLAWLLKHPVGSAAKIKAVPHCCTLVEAFKEEYLNSDHLLISNPFDLSFLFLLMWFSCSVTNFCLLTTSPFVVESPSSLKRQGTKTTCRARCHQPAPVYWIMAKEASEKMWGNLQTPPPKQRWC